jgi:hypothetical protein
MSRHIVRKYPGCHTACIVVVCMGLAFSVAYTQFEGYTQVKEAGVKP